MKFLQKILWFNFIQFILGYFNEFNFKQSRWNYKTFISKFFTLLKLIHDTVNQTQWVISLHKLYFYQRRFFFKVSWYSFWTMKITIDCISFIAFWSFEGPWWRQFCAFLINVKFIGTTDVGEFGVQKLTRIYLP